MSELCFKVHLNYCSIQTFKFQIPLVKKGKGYLLALIVLRRTFDIALDHLSSTKITQVVQEFQMSKLDFIGNNKAEMFEEHLTISLVTHTFIQFLTKDRIAGVLLFFSPWKLPNIHLI